MADILSKIAGFILPTEEVEENVAETEEQNEKKNTAAGIMTKNSRKVANGGEVADPYYGDYSEEEPPEEKKREPLRVYKHPKMNIIVFEPANFNDTKVAADTLKASKTVLMNFEKIEYSEQVRICDFMNGACYVLDGSVRRISANMVLYVPKGVTIESIAAAQKN